MTLRLRLTLWNLAVLAVSLALFGFLLNLANQRRVSADIDRDLRQRAVGAATGPPPPPGIPRRPPGSPENFVDFHRPQYFDAQGHRIGPGDGNSPFDPNLLRSALSGQVGGEEVIYEGIPARVVAMKIPGGPMEGGVVLVATDMTAYNSLMHEQVITLIVLLPLAVLAAGLGAMFLTRTALRPIAQVTEAAAKIGEENLSERLRVQGSDELAQLSSTFNAMVARLESAFEKIKAAFEQQRRFTADASHELRTPLTRLRLATSSAISGGLSREEMVAQAKVADQAAQSMSGIVEELLLLAQADAGTLGAAAKPTDLRVVVSEAVECCTHPFRITVNLAEDPVTATVDPSHVRRAVLNLLQNALRHTPEGKRIIVRVCYGELSRASSPSTNPADPLRPSTTSPAYAGAETSHAHSVPSNPADEFSGPRPLRGNKPASPSIEVIDEGEGISSDHLARLGERFYRVDTARSRAEGGFGLGLAICKSIVESHGGALEIESEPGAGTTARLVFAR